MKDPKDRDGFDGGLRFRVTGFLGVGFRVTVLQVQGLGVKVWGVRDLGQFSTLAVPLARVLQLGVAALVQSLHPPPSNLP